MAPNNHTDHDSAARTAQGVSAMSQPNAWLFQPTRISIYFDLHEYCRFLSRREERELMTLGQIFLLGGQMCPAFRSDYDEVVRAYKAAYARASTYTAAIGL